MSFNQRQIRLLLLLLLITINFASSLYFEDGFDHHYTYSSQSDILGLHNVTTIIKFRVRSVNETSEKESLNQLIVDSFVQQSEKGYVANNPHQWQLNNTFLFTVGADGQVTFVHFHPEEKDEILTMKKVLASTLSLKVKVENGDSWKFTSHEEDHAGDMEHEYEAFRHSDGLMFIRKHQSSNDVHRLHNKTIHLDVQGTPVNVDAVDNITLRHTPTTVTSNVDDGFTDIGDRQSGEFPKIASISRSQLKMTSKRRHDEQTMYSLHDMRKDTLSVKQKPPAKVSLKAVESDIQKYLTCIHAIENKFDRNRTECVHNLRILIHSLEEKDFLALGTEALTKQCEPLDVLCVDERNLYIDIIAREGSAKAQLLILELVMRNPNVTEDDLRRCLFHSVAITTPELELVRHIEQLCFVEDVNPGDTPALSKTQMRACLSLGAVAKSLHDKNVTEADRIVHKIEHWLDHHNESKSMGIVKPRERRSVIQHDTSAQKHIETKMVLIQSLGNAGKQRSLRHIQSYMEPNVGVTAWRRAAIHSLRHFSCKDSAHALLKSAVHDDDDMVRKTAINILKKHPNSKNFSVEHENVVLSKNYSYPVVSRVRRGLLQILEAGIYIKIEPPGADWNKDVGTSDIGASFGLTLRNILDLKLSLLSGHFKVDVYDGAFAEVHVGLLNFQLDIFKAYICFNGHIKYDLNILKDFGINRLSDLVKIYDKIVGKIVTPVTQAIQSFRDIIMLFKGRSFGNIVNTIVNTVKNLPSILWEVNLRLEKFVKKIFSISGSAIIEEIKAVISELVYLIDGVKQDILKFYNEIVDIVTVGLPYVSKKIVDGFNYIVQAFGQILNSPTQAISKVSLGLTNIQMAITMTIDIMNRVSDACSFITGRTLVWLNTPKEIPRILQRFSNALMKLTQSFSKWKHHDYKYELNKPFSDGIIGTKTSLHSLESDLKAEWKAVFSPLKPLLDIIGPFYDSYKNIMDVISSIKEAYTTVKETIETSKALVQKVFGPKFYLGFPTERRLANGNCKEGVWPITNVSGDYDTTGVDLELGYRQSIQMPVNGIVHIKLGEKVVIQPTDPEFSEQEIVIENIEPERKHSEKNVPAGEKIGKAGRSRRCYPNSIHVSVRKSREKEGEDADYEYVDPSPFLDRLVPVPKWIERCNDYEFRLLGNTVESGVTARKEDQETTTTSIDRDIGSAGKDIDDMLGSVDPKYRPDDPSLYDPTSFTDSLKKSIEESTKAFSNIFKTALFGKDGPKVPSILDILDINKYDTNWLLEKLASGSQLHADFRDILHKLSIAKTSLPEGNPATMSLSYVKNLLNSHGLKPSLKAGDAGYIADDLMTMAGKECPAFKGAIAAGFGHVCTVHRCCLGITCSVPIPFGAKMDHLSVTMSINPENSVIEATVNSKTIKIVASDIEEMFKLDLQLFGFQLYLVVHGRKATNAIILTAEVKLCTEQFLGCVPPIDLFHEIKFDIQLCRTKRSTINEISLYALSLPNLMTQLCDYQLLNKNVVSVIENVRETVLKELMNEPAEKLGLLKKEFRDEVDICLRGNVPIPPLDIDIFKLKIEYPAGPIFLSFGFGAGAAIGLGVKVGFCFLSMAAEVTATPWVGAKVWGDLAIDVFILRGGFRLTGYLLETKFPTTLELVFSKYPIDVGFRMDLVFTPLRLELKAFVELDLFVKTIILYEGILWHYAVPSIHKNIFTIKKRDEDQSPPVIMPSTINERKKRSGVQGCIVKQILGRPYYDPAFSLEMYAQDEVSEVKLFYAIGTHRGGTNVEDWTEMGGNSLMVPAKLPGGVPLYWSVKANNSQGLETISQCSLDSYDSTLPDGRVEHAYKCSSHPYKLKASIMAFEDSPLVDVHYKAVGFSPGQFGSQVVDWEFFQLGRSTTRNGVAGALKHFTIPREGKLIAWILKSQKTAGPEICAQRCIDYGSNCVSFDYEHHSEICDFHDVVQGANAYLRISGTYSNYERLGSGYNAPAEYDNLPLTHGSTYFVNAKIRNILGYDSYLVGEGTMVDFTPPEPGLIKTARSDIMRADSCTAAITQRCDDVTWKENHRVIIDGPGSGTVFNGHEPLHDELYTLTNHYVSANWKGFHDDQSGIWGYTWAVGRNVCLDDAISFKDPYAHLMDKKFWTDSSFHKGIHLPDGPYYITVQALNGAELGGSLVTTVCHSTPFIVDTTAPVFHNVTDIIYDEDFDLIAIYYNATDDLSNIVDTEFGLGKTKYDVKLKRYSLHAAIGVEDPFLAIKELGLEEGIPAWIRIRVTNDVKLFTSGHGNEPILIDRSPPISGHVLDGDRLRQDRKYQAENQTICAQWLDFFDHESGIDRFLWGVGSRPGLDDVVKFHNLTRYEKTSCSAVLLQHNHTYFSTVFAYNNALNSKSANSSSDGVLVDVTPPIAGHVQDGILEDVELLYSSETVSKFANWHGYFDPESGIYHYKVGVFINFEHKKTFNVGNENHFEDHTISMEHNDEVYFTVHGVNGADLENDSSSDGFKVDLTTPLLSAISDSKSGLEYQSDNTAMYLMWEFKDPESGIKEYRTVIYETLYGVKQKFWPSNAINNISIPVSPMFTKMIVILDSLNLKNGALYTLHVTALNRALLATSHETTGITIDVTAPLPPKVHVGLPKDEEEQDENGNVMHNDQYAIRLSWYGRDPESGIKHFFVAIGTSEDPESVVTYIDYGEDTTAYIQNIFFDITSTTGTYYQVSVKAVNGAGLMSEAGISNKIFVQKANIPGAVFDGRSLFEDESYTTDKYSVAASFYGFASESCSIISYDWAVGTTEYGSDIQTYTNFGLLMLNETHGQCQIHIELNEDTTYYVTVRAVTGCQEEYILSSSDGITLDTKPPLVLFNEVERNDTAVAAMNGVIYQANTDSLSITSNVTDTHSIATVQYALGLLPLLDDYHQFTDEFSDLTNVVTLVPGQSVFITTDSLDKAGNKNISSSFAIIADTTGPFIRELECTPYLSSRKSLLTCTWVTVQEHESLSEKVIISLGSTRSSYDILDDYVVPKTLRTFNKDLHSHINTMSNLTSVYVNVIIKNVVGQTMTYGRDVTVDRTPPVADRIDVVTGVGTNKITEHQKCQLPMTYAEVRPNGVIDDESGIDPDRYEVCIGYKAYGTEILDYTPVTIGTDGVIFIGGFSLPDGTIFYATLRIYNKAGLRNGVTSDSVVISQMPTLRVIDGDKEEDIDYQSVTSIIQGRWEYSDPCPVKEASWSVSDLTGRVLFDYQSIPSASRIFYNDVVSLENGMKYIVTVRTLDFMGRSKTSRSDGISVRIQPPLPGFVRDGLHEDLNYQFSTTELSTNWDSFGDDSKDPTQSIHHYEVAVGNDRRYEKTRTNVHYFVNVGLNTSYTFENLNLTSKRIKYYITVRSYSMAGGYTEGYSNGIRVGYTADIHVGTISVTKYQSSTTSIEASWTGFRADIDIIDYMIGVSSHKDAVINDTMICSMFQNKLSTFDIYPLTSVGLNEYYKIHDLHLHHKDTLFVTLVAKDEAGMCTGITSNNILVDTTPPKIGSIFINDIVSEIVYAKLNTELHIRWNGFVDEESGLSLTKVTLYQCNGCDVQDVESDPNCFDIEVNDVETDDTSSFYQLQLDTVHVYYIAIKITNGAQLSTRVQSVPILVDTTSPLIGSVKIARDWYSLSTFEHSTSELHGYLALANSWNDFVCPAQKKVSPFDFNLDFLTFSDDFSTDFVVVNWTGAFLGIGFNADLTKIIKSSIMSDKKSLLPGNYLFTARIARGTNIVTTLALITNTVTVPFSIYEKPLEHDFDESSFDNMTGLLARVENYTDIVNVTRAKVSSKDRQVESPVPANDTKSNNQTNFEEDAYGIGMHFLGYKIANNTNWHHIFWARSKFTSIQRWFQLPFDPTSEDHRYTIQVDKKSEYLDTTLDLTLLVDNEEIITITGFMFDGKMNLVALTWNENNYKPPINDFYHPFYSDAIIKEILIPDEGDKLCRHGKGFFDGESSIKEIMLGVSDSKTELGNLSPLTKYKTFCYPCKQPCVRLCNNSCSGEHLKETFNIIPLDVVGLHLKPSNKNYLCQNITSDAECNSTAYYLNVKVINFAGMESTAFSNAIQVDQTPPECEYVKCLDPDYSKDEPTKYLGSSSTIGAYWNCSEDISQVERYSVQVLSSNNTVIMPSIDVGLKTKVNFDLGNGTFEDGENYTVELTAVNTAGLAFKKNCSVHVSLYPPDVVGILTAPLFTDTVTLSSNENLPLWTTSQTQIGLEWQGGNANIDYYEWQIGTSRNGRDIFPPVKIGGKLLGSSAIVKGELELDRIPINKTVADFRNVSSMSPEEISNLTTTSEQEKSFFFMEPGRCVHQSLSAVGFSHRKIKIQGMTVCIKRENDVYLNATNITPDTTDTKTKKVATKLKSSNGLAGDLTETIIGIEADLFDGGFNIGKLSQADIDSNYASAATSDFKPFIVDPELTLDRTSRLLRNRIKKLCNLTFFMSPSPFVEYESITLNVTVGKDCEKDTDYQPGLIYWDYDKERWVHIDEGCSDNLTADMHSNVYVTQICRNTKDTDVGNLNASAILTTPRMVTLAQIKSDFPNNPPNIITQLLLFTEDKTNEYNIETVDLENDTLEFEIVDYPFNLNCELANDTGHLECTPFDDFYGTDVIKVKVTEKGLPPFEKPFLDERQIFLSVSRQPDSTDRFYVDLNNTVISEKRPSMVRKFVTEANRSSTFSAGTLVLADVDGGELFVEKLEFTPLGNSTYKLTITDPVSIPIGNVSSRTYRSLKAYNITFQFSPKIKGNMNLRLIAQTADGGYTPSFTAELYVLENPCVHGHCSHPKLGTAPCGDIMRSISFEGYICACDAGFEGQWCHIDTDECQTASCVTLFDCEDMVNGYQCNINISKMMAILMSSLAAAALCVCLKYQHSRRQNAYSIHGIVKSSIEDLSGCDYIPQTYTRRHSDAGQPTTSSFELFRDPKTHHKALITTQDLSNPSWEASEQENQAASIITATEMKLLYHHSNDKLPAIATVESKTQRSNSDSMLPLQRESKDADTLVNLKRTTKRSLDNLTGLKDTMKGSLDNLMDTSL